MCQVIIVNMVLVEAYLVPPYVLSLSVYELGC